MTKFLLIWLTISILSGCFMNIKINDEYIHGVKRFIIAFICALPFAIVLTLFMALIIPFIIIVFVIIIICTVLK